MNIKRLLYLDEPLVLGKRRRILYGVLALICFGIGVLLSYTYRPYIYSHQIRDFHIADTIGNIVAVPAAAFFYYAIYKRVPYTRVFVLFVIWVVWLFYEFFLSNTFDCYDIAATTLMCMATYFALPGRISVG